MNSFTSKLQQYNIEATDGEMGKIKDLYIEEDTWNIRYAVVDTRKWLPERKVLLPPSTFIRVNEADESLEVDYDKEMIKNSPPVPEEQDLTRDKEDQLINYFGWSYYFPKDVMLSNDNRVLGVFHDRSEQVKQEHEDFEREQLIADHQDNNSKLRSHEEILRSRVHAKDGKLGSVVDFLYDENWKIHSIIVQSSNLGMDEYSLYPTSAITTIDWYEGDLYLEETRDGYNKKQKFSSKKELLEIL